MKTVPSLVASSTVGVAATGLALGRRQHAHDVTLPATTTTTTTTTSTTATTTIVPARTTTESRRHVHSSASNQAPRRFSFLGPRPATSSAVVPPRRDAAAAAVTSPMPIPIDHHQPQDQDHIHALDSQAHVHSHSLSHSHFHPDSTSTSTSITAGTGAAASNRSITAATTAVAAADTTTTITAAAATTTTTPPTPTTTTTTSNININTNATTSSPPPPSSNARGLSSISGSFRSAAGSRFKRLSLVAVSESTSRRSSVALESPALTISAASGSIAPLRPSSQQQQHQQHPPPLLHGRRRAESIPNKLVKRRPSERAAANPLLSRSSSKSQGHHSLTLLPRPATSHQRSATLQQFTFHLDKENETLQTSTPLRASFDPDLHLHTPPPPSSAKRDSQEQRHLPAYRPFFEALLTKLPRERTVRRPVEGSPESVPMVFRRIVPEEGIVPVLLKPAAMTASEDMAAAFAFVGEPTYDFEHECTPIREASLAEVDEFDSSKRPRRSISMHFSSPTSWIPRSSSLRVAKRGLPSSTKRHASAPVEGDSRSASPTDLGQRQRDLTDPGLYQLHSNSAEDVASDPFIVAAAGARIRNSSSPLPPLTRLSSFNVDLNRLGLTAEGTHAARSVSSPETSARPSSMHILPGNFTGTQRHRPTSQFLDPISPSDRASTLIGSDHDPRGFFSGEDDDTDFHSETGFDSYRTGATGSIRSQNLPLDAMFDESPPSAQSKRSGPLHDLAVAGGGFLDVTGKIIEEDESLSTPIKNKFSREDLLSTPVRDSRAADVFSSKLMLADADFARLSIEEDEDDEDWTRDDDVGFGHTLSPPSLSRSVSQATRAALADLTNSPIGNQSNPADDRRRGNLFDWSEQTPLEKSDARPRTSHVKHHDLRSGRVLGRRAPAPLHIRSQSVPAVPEGISQRENSKLTPKFGTWGLAAKGVSEDWDNDFEFEATEFDTADENGEPKFDVPILVPEAIQASQANVKGHVGQIREICLLVEDLKRLRGQGRERGLLSGSSAHLWEEAEGIIALAIPDEEEPAFSPPRSPTSADFEFENTGDEFRIEIDEVKDDDVFFEDQSRRRSVFSPEDDIFGNFTEPAPTQRASLSRPKTANRDTTDIARSVMEHMHQHRSTSDPLLSDLNVQSPNKMPFDTTSLRDLVHKASSLTRTLAEIIRKADGFSPSPSCTPLRERDSSPAFTRVFTDPLASPPKSLIRSQSSNSVIGTSIDSSPSRRRLGRMHMMTVV